MKKRIGAILLTICMLVGLLPTTALAAETVDSTNGYQMTLDYDADACAITVLDKNNSNVAVADGGYLIQNSWGEVCGNVTVTVNKGYRIKSAALTQNRGTTDLTEDFITGVFGWKPMLYASSDFTLEIVTEEIPEIPSVTGIQLYSDEARTTPIEVGANLISTEDSEPYVYVKATYSDGKEYPMYTARGYMEYSLDGTTWETTEFGGFYHYFPVDWCQYETKYDYTSTVHENYDFRIRIEPDDMYCTGGTFYSEVYHVNGGVDGTAGGSGDSGSGDSGDSGSGDSGDSGSGDSDETETGCLLTFNFPEDLCDMHAENLDEEGTFYYSGDRAPADAWLSYNITSIADGYRIKSVTMNGVDWTDGFVNGAYGSIGTSIDEDTTISVELELIPEVLPSVNSVTLYMDSAFADLATENVDVDGDTRFYGKAVYSDGVDYPAYYIGGVWEYSTDGTNWEQDLAWGDNRFDYWPGWTSRAYFDPDAGDFFVNGSYDLRLRVTPKDLYTTGDDVLSNVIHINGGAGGSGSGETETHQLAAPTDLEWHKFYPWGETTAFSYNGAISWVTGDPEYDQTFQISVYKDNELQYSTTWDYTAGSGHTHWSDWDFSLGEVQWLGNGTYHYTVQALGDGETTCDSEVTTSGTWAFSMPGSKISAPTNLAWDGTTATWTEDTNTAGFVIDVYYSADDNTATSTDSLTRKGGRVWYYDESGDTNATSDFAAQYMTAAGYYYFTISSVSNDISQNWHSDTVLSSAYEVACDHSWSGWTVTKEATCTADGSQTRTCGSCGATESEPIGKLGHDYQSVVTAPTCTDGGYTTHTCSRCGDSYTDSETTALGHDWDDGVITTEPTESADGVKTYTCSVCGGTKTEAISKLAKQEVSWFPAGPITWTYGQVVSAQNTAYNDTADGGALTYTSSDESVATVDAYGKATIVGAGTAQITATAAAVPGKYAETSASYTLIINKAPLTVTASDASITYGQAPANAGWTAAGFVYDDSAADVTGTAVYTYGYEQFGKVGSYDIHVSGLTSDNYEMTYASGTLTVNKAADYTITLSNLSQRDDAVTDVTASVAPQDTTAEIKVEYLVNDAWTETVPAEAGKYQVRASLASSDNIVTDGAYTTGTLTVERSIVVDDTDVSVTVEGEKAEITVTDEELTEIVNNADGEVSIDLSGVTDVTELVLPGDLMDALSESDKADGLTVTTGDAAITMSDAVLDTVAKELTGEDTVTVKLTTVEENELNGDQQAALDSITQDAVIVEVALVITHADGSTTELHELGGNVEITVPFEGEVPAGKYIVVCYLSDDGNVTYLRATYDTETKQVTFKTNHFSNYAVFVSGDPMVVVNGGSGSGLYAEGATVTIKAESKSGYRFNGWEIVAGNVTLADAKKAETSFVMPAEAVELTATYRKNSSGGGSGGSSATYSIKIEDTKHGEVAAGSKTASKSDTVTLTVDPDAGYTLETLTVTDKNGKELKLTKKGSKYTFTMPAGKVTVAATFMEDNSMLNFFADVPADAYYYDAVLWAAENEITGGTSATTFSPDRTCTRAQAVTFLWRAAGSPAPESESMPFADVPADAYYYDAVLWAVEQGITAGTSETTFSPDMKCTRAQIVTFLWRAQKTPAAETVNPFADVANDAYYADAVIWAMEQGITAGTSADTFSPNANCTRAQIVTFLWRYMGE